MAISCNNLEDFHLPGWVGNSYPLVEIQEPQVLIHNPMINNIDCVYKNVEYMWPNSWYTYIRCKVSAFQRGFCFQYTFGRRFVIGEEA